MVNMNEKTMTPPKILEDLMALEKSADWKKAESLILNHKDEFDAGVYYFNLGIIKLKQQDFVGARIALETAKKNAFESLVLDEALNETKEALSSEAIESVDAWEKVEISLIELPIQFYISLTVVILITFLLIKKYLDSIVTKVFWILFAFIPLLFKLLFFPQMQTLVTTTDLPVYFGPSKVFEKVSELPPGIKIYTGKNVDSKWLQVLFPKNQQGWVENNETSFKFIKEEI